MVHVCLYIVFIDETREGTTSKLGSWREVFWNLKDLELVEQGRIYVV